MRFSVIIPVYNAEAFLSECLDTVIDQSFLNWEAICVDDGSTDRSGAILDMYARKDGRIRVIHKKNAGVSAARNDALACAKGEYVTFVDADDLLDKGWLDGINQTIGAGCDIAHVGSLVWQDSEAVPQDRVKRSSGVVQYIDRSHLLSYGVEQAFLNGYSFLWALKRTIIRETRYSTKLWMHEDCLFIAQLMLRASSLNASDFNGYFYRRHADSVCSKSMRGSGSEFVDVINAICAYYSDNLELFNRLGVGDKILDVISYGVFFRVNMLRDLAYHACTRLEHVPGFKKMTQRVHQLHLNPSHFAPGFCWRLCYWLVLRFGMEWPMVVRWSLGNLHSRMVQQRERGI